jgi:hypothetical protein
MPDDQPLSDPLPSPRHSAMLRFWRVFRLLGLLSIVVAVIAVILVARGDPTVHIHMLIATALGIGLMVLVGTALMALVFISNSSGHDDEAATFRKEKDKE